MHICPRPLVGEGAPLLPVAQGTAQQGPRRHTPLHCPIFHCQAPARAQFIMAMFGNYPCKCRVIPPDKGLIALKGVSQSSSDTLVWSASAITAPRIWAGPRTHS